ncbi:MAG: hypothetical protein IJG42_04695 [Muribaculaceae bacterium]|nr:hypothetical protein [Muribaculaceae bacterium]
MPSLPPRASPTRSAVQYAAMASLPPRVTSPHQPPAVLSSTQRWHRCRHVASPAASSAVEYAAMASLPSRRHSRPQCRPVCSDAIAATSGHAITTQGKALNQYG